MNKLVRALLPLADIVLTPVVYPSAIVLKAVRRIGVQRLPLCKRALMTVGVFPIRNHYYEPLFDARGLKRPLDQARDLVGIDWNISEQLSVLESFHYNDELRGIPDSPGDLISFHFNNTAFESGDAEYWYSLIRTKKALALMKSGCGMSSTCSRRS